MVVTNHQIDDVPAEQPAPGELRTVSASAYSVMSSRLRLNFLIAAWTNIVALVILLGSASVAVVFVLRDEPIAAGIPALVGALDIVYGAIERPWRQLWIANNRLALSESIWIAYLESKDAISDVKLSDDQRFRLRQAQSLWIDRMTAIAMDDFGEASTSLRTLNEANQQIELRLRGAVAIEAPLKGYTEFGEGNTGLRLDELRKK